MLLLEPPDGIVVATREQVQRLVREQLQGNGLVGEPLSDRRAAADRDNPQ